MNSKERAIQLVRNQRAIADQIFSAIVMDLEELRHYKDTGGIRAFNLERLEEDASRMRIALLRAEAFEQFLK